MFNNLSISALLTLDATELLHVFISISQRSSFLNVHANSWMLHNF